MTPAQFWQIEMQNQQNQQEQQQRNQQQNQQNQQNIMSGIMGIAGAYAENKQLEARAGSYDDIGKILNTAMFKDNPDASAAFGNLQKEKDPRKKVMGYEQLFSLVGPMSNMMMAQGRMGIQQQGQQIQAGMPAQRARIDTQSTIAGGGGTVPLQDDPMGYAPSAPPGTGATQAASAWYNQSRVPTSMAGGGMKPFWK